MPFEKIIKWEGNTVPNYQQADYDATMRNSKVISRLVDIDIKKGTQIRIKKNEENWEGNGIEYKMGLLAWDNTLFRAPLGGVFKYDTNSDNKKKELFKLYQKGELLCKEIIDKKRLVFYKQYFKKIWKEVNTIASQGCLMTCIAQIVSYYKNNETKPTNVDEAMDIMEEVAYIQQQNGEAESKIKWPYLGDSSGMHEWNVAEYFEMDFERWSIDEYTQDQLRIKIVERIKENKPTVALLKTGYKTHFVNIVGIKYNGVDETGEATHFIINDPGTEDLRAKYIDIKTMYSTFWARPIVAIDLFNPI